jgi:P22 coat protein - gene protein 5
VANTFLTPSVIATQALANLYETTVMAQLVHRDYEQDFQGRVGDTITVRKPPTFTAREYSRASGITIQDASESGIPVVLNHFADVSFSVTSEEMTLEIGNFNDRLLGPAMEAISQKIDADLLTLRDDITHSVGTTAGELWSDPKALIAANRVLTQNKVPMNGRAAVVGPVTGAEWIKSDLLNRADLRGDTDGLREAYLGSRLFNTDPYMTNHITVPAQTTGNSTTEVGVVFHPTAFALVFRPLELPRGAAQAAVANYRGFGLRVVVDYDIDKKQDVVSVDCLYGVKTIDPNRAVLVKGTNVP